MAENLTELEKVDLAIDVLLEMEKCYIKIAFVVLPLLSFSASIVSYLMHSQFAALFFFYFGVGATWFATPTVIAMLVMETSYLIRRVQLLGRLTRLDAAAIATNVLFAVILCVLFYVYTFKLFSLKLNLAKIRVE
jgi:hypothetical protein